LIISLNSDATFALSKTVMMVSIEFRSWSTRPGSLHHVRCFEFSCLHPHGGHLLTMSSSERDSFELQPHQPETCLVMKVRKVLGYPEMARSYPLHHTVSKWADKTIPFLLKNLLVVKWPQDSSNSKQGVPLFSSLPSSSKFV
jgi:hypothetical protein